MSLLRIVSALQSIDQTWFGNRPNLVWRKHYPSLFLALVYTINRPEVTISHSLSPGEGSAMPWGKQNCAESSLAASQVPFPIRIRTWTGVHFRNQKPGVHAKGTPKLPKDFFFFPKTLSRSVQKTRLLATALSRGWLVWVNSRRLYCIGVGTQSFQPIRG